MARFLPHYMKGCFSFLRLFCQFPLKISNGKLDTSYLWLIYTVLLCLTYAGVFNYAFLTEDRSQMGIIYGANPILGYASLSNMLIPMFLVPAASTKFWKKFYQVLLVTDSILESHGGVIPYRRQKITLICFSVVVIFCYAFVKCADLIQAAWPKMHVMNHFSHVYNLLAIIIIINIVYSTMFLRWRFQCINLQLSTLFKNVKVMPQTFGKTIRTYQRAHYRLCQLSLKLNSHFTLAVLLTLANTCGAFLTSLYGAFTLGHLKSAADLINSGKWHFIEMIVIVGLLMPFDLLKSEANKTGSVLHEAFFDAEDGANEILLNTFSLQLIHTKLAFSTGLFNISMTIALPAAGAITTYLVIFVQFI